MRRTIIVVIGLLIVLTLCVSAGETTVERRKAEILAKADRVFGKRYDPQVGRPRRLYDEETETGPPDAVLYRHDKTYVVQLVFAADGTIARLEFFPEEELYKDSKNDVAARAELSRSEMRWFIKSANALQPLGKRLQQWSCGDSSRSRFCFEFYDAASVSGYDNRRITKRPVIVGVAISYRQSVIGVVEDVRVIEETEAKDSQRQLKVGGRWYCGRPFSVDQDPPEIFDTVGIGTAVQLISFGCAGNEKACRGFPVESRPNSRVE